MLAIIILLFDAYFLNKLQYGVFQDKWKVDILL